MIFSIEQKQAYKARKELKQFFGFFGGKSSLEKLSKGGWGETFVRFKDLLTNEVDDGGVQRLRKTECA